MFKMRACRTLPNAQGHVIIQCPMLVHVKIVFTVSSIQPLYHRLKLPNKGELSQYFNFSHS